MGDGDWKDTLRAAVYVTGILSRGGEGRSGFVYHRTPQPRLRQKRVQDVYEEA
jgi:hypothetical protein